MFDMAATITNRGLQVLATQNASAIDLRVAVFTGAVPTAATIRDWNFLSDVTTTEAAATNYSRQDVSGLAVTEDDSGDQVVWSADAMTISSVGTGETWTHVAWYVFDASDTAAELIMIDEPSSTLVTNGGDVTLPAFSVNIVQA